MNVERERLDVDVLIVGAGPAGLSCGVHLMRLLKRAGGPPEGLTVAVLEKSTEVGQHILSGAVVDPRGFDDLFEKRWLEEGCPVESPVTAERVYYLAERRKVPFPIVPTTFSNDGFYVMTLSRVVQWMRGIAEREGVDIFEGFPAKEVILDGDRVCGVVTTDQGVGRDGLPRGNFTPGAEIRAKVTVFCEGSRGSLTKQLVDRLGLRGPNPQTYGVGVKEVWEIPEGRIVPGEVIHTAGWPLSHRHYGGGWVYGLSGDRVSIGFVSALDYEEPRFDPFEATQRWKTHPLLRSVLQGGRLLLCGAKTVPEGGYWSQPRLHGDGFLIAGDGGSFLSTLRLKGVHTAVKSGMLAAETIAHARQRDRFDAGTLALYDRLYRESWLYRELWDARNFRQAFQRGLFPGIIRTGVMLFTGGRILKDPLPARADHEHMKNLSELPAIKQESAGAKPFVPDGVLTIDKLTGVYHAGSVHEEDQPVHLLVADTDICRTRCQSEYGNPCEHFCPAKVYEMVEDVEAAPRGDAGGLSSRRLQINHSNCVHCKTCDIMDPYGIITWTVPADAGGPKYLGM